MKRCAIVVAAALFLATNAFAGALATGSNAPDFSLPDQNGKTVRLADFRGKKSVVLAFYVLAFTGG